MTPWRWLLDLLFGERRCCLSRRVAETEARIAARHARERQ